MNAMEGNARHSLFNLCDAMTPTNEYQSPQSSARFEADKQAVYRHPLFPLLALLLEKCEEATRGDFDTKEVMTDLRNEVKTFLEHGKSGGQKLLSGDPEVDGLMLKALQVLRIHLLELEKVQDLCRDFCRRYIACLRGKLSSENLLRVDGEGSSLDGDEVVFDSSCANGNALHPALTTTPSYPPEPRRSECFQPSLDLNGSRVPCAPVPMSSDDDEDTGSGGGSGKVKRGVLPRRATTVLRTWLFQHLVHPYPTEEEKRQLATQTKLTLLQVNNWFINARRRILQPMLDSAHMTAHSKPEDEFITKRLRLSAAGSSSGAGSDGEDDTRSFGDSDQ